MKKSELRNIIKESIKELMNEQSQYPGFDLTNQNQIGTLYNQALALSTFTGIVDLEFSTGATNSYSKVACYSSDAVNCVPTALPDYNTLAGMQSLIDWRVCISQHSVPCQVGDLVKTTFNMNPANLPNYANASGACVVNVTQASYSGQPVTGGHTNFLVVDDINGQCSNITPGCTDSTANNYDPNATVDDGSCDFGPGSLGITGNYTVFNYPSGFDVTDWTNNFVDMIMNHPNPCNFLVQRIIQFYTALGNQISFDINGNIFNPQDLIVGPLQANMLMQKLVVCVELYNQLCAGIQEQSGNISQIIQTAKNIKMDPKIGGIVKQAVIKLRDKMSKPADPNLDRMQKLAGIPMDKPMDKPEEK
jgi:hypothetical protein